MRLYFAGYTEARSDTWMPAEFSKNLFVLGSYFYLKNKSTRARFNPEKYREFLLDSGVFTFVYGTNQDGVAHSINWKEYIREYAHFIKEYDIDKFMELDADAIIGYDRVKYYRDMLEDLVGRPCIPVYHLGRSDEEFVETCKGRPYVAYGTNAGEGVKNNPNVAKIVKLAHENGSKIHILGFGDPLTLARDDIKADSCDATTWFMNCMYGHRLNWKPGDTVLTNKRFFQAEKLKSWRERAYSLCLWRKYALWCAENVDVVWPEDLNYPRLDEDSMTEAELLEKYRVMQKAFP